MEALSDDPLMHFVLFLMTLLSVGTAASHLNAALCQTSLFSMYAEVTVCSYQGWVLIGFCRSMGKNAWTRQSACLNVLCCSSYSVSTSCLRQKPGMDLADTYITFVRQNQDLLRDHVNDELYIEKVFDVSDNSCFDYSSLSLIFVNVSVICIPNIILSFIVRF